MRRFDIAIMGLVLFVCVTGQTLSANAGGRRSTANCGERPDLKAQEMETVGSAANMGLELFSRRAKAAELGLILGKKDLLSGNPQPSILSVNPDATTGPLVGASPVAPPGFMKLEPSMVVRSRGYLNDEFSFEAMMNRLASTAGISGNDSGLILFQDLWKTAMPYDGNTNPLGCQSNPGGTSTLINGFGYTCERPEGHLSKLKSLGNLADALVPATSGSGTGGAGGSGGGSGNSGSNAGNNASPAFEIVSLVNRGDLVSLDEKVDHNGNVLQREYLTCGEYRVIARASCGSDGKAGLCQQFTQQQIPDADGLGDGQIYLSFEFEPPISEFTYVGNDTARPVNACQSLQLFWKDLGEKTTSQAANLLHQLYFEGLEIPEFQTGKLLHVPAVIDARFLGLPPASGDLNDTFGQLRTNVTTKPQGRWMFREYAFRKVPGHQPRLMPVSLRNNLATELWYEIASTCTQAGCEPEATVQDAVKEFKDHIDALTAQSLASLSGFVFDNACLEAGEAIASVQPPYLQINNDILKKAVPAPKTRRAIFNLNFNSCAGCHAGGAAFNALQELDEVQQINPDRWQPPNFVHSIGLVNGKREIDTPGSEITEKFLFKIRCASLARVAGNILVEPQSCLIE